MNELDSYPGYDERVQEAHTRVKASRARARRSGSDESEMDLEGELPRSNRTYRVRRAIHCAHSPLALRRTAVAHCWIDM
jgi:hypothetical protein